MMQTDNQNKIEALKNKKHSIQSEMSNIFVPSIIAISLMAIMTSFSIKFIPLSQA